MALSTAKISELPFHNPIPLCSRPSLSLLRCRFRLLFSASASLRVAERGGGGGDSDARRNPIPRTRRYPWDEDYHHHPGGGPHRSRPSTPPSAPWIQRWTPPTPQVVDPPHPEKRRKKKEQDEEEGVGYMDRSDDGRGSIERIVHRLRNLGLDREEQDGGDSDLELDGDVRLGDLLERSWSRPDSAPLDDDQTVLPWERGMGDNEVVQGQDGGKELKKRRVRAPSLAELTIEDSELRRLRRLGIMLRERITIPKAGVTQAIVEKIHDAWRKSELVRLKFHETLAHDMKTAHEIVERRTGGLVIWRSGSVMVVYRGSSYKRPTKSTYFDGESSPTEVLHDGDVLLIPDVSHADKLAVDADDPAISLAPVKCEPSHVRPDHVESMTEEEQEYNHLLDGLGPRFVDWWGTGILPVDADLLPQNIPGYRTPFRLLPTGMRSRLTNAEMTNLRKLARSLPSHFALGRNRNHHGLAAAIVKLWETSLVVKIAVKRGIQNTNNKLMAEELKTLTGGILLLRNKYYIVIYRGKDFLPTRVATALAERQELTKDIQDVEEKARGKDFLPTTVATALAKRQELTKDIQDVEEKACGMDFLPTSVITGLTDRQELGNDIQDIEVKTHHSAPGESHTKHIEGLALAGTLAEFHEAQARWGREVSAEEREEMKEEASRFKTARVVKRIEHKLSLAQAKKLRAERLLAKIESSMVPVGPSDDLESITDEERSVFRRIGLRMKAYLPLGIRGVFDGVIENMHLHWKHRELVKLISKQKTLSFVEDTARLLEYESGGILVAIERVPKGYALTYYRGKNYQRPISLRPRNLLTKAKALKRSVAMQRHEALSQHISELEKTIEQIKSELGDCNDVEGENKRNSEHVRHGHVSQFTQIEDQDSCIESEDDDVLDKFVSEDGVNS